MNNKLGFTLAEVLITLGIIGIVAALTLPTIISNHKKKTIVTSVQKTYSILNQSLKRAEVDNGPIEYWPQNAEMDVYEFFNKYWVPYYNDISLCDSAISCGYKSNYSIWISPNGELQEHYTFVTDDTRIFFRYGDGTVVFYPRNTTDANGNTAYLNRFYIDINGPKKPNVYGTDIFIFVLDFKEGLKPYCHHMDLETLTSKCNAEGYCCAAKLMKDGWQIKDDYLLH